jgi:2,3-dihydroxybenzoate decarboxylase
VDHHDVVKAQDVDIATLPGLAMISTVTHGSAAAKASGNPSPAPAHPRMRKVALEEHFMLPDFVGYLAETKANIRTDLYDHAVPLLSDFGDGRLAVMDQHGVDYVVLSLSGPGVQIEPDTVRATTLARSCNDTLAREIQKRPDRYGGFAHLALQDPHAAADELERCMKDLGFKGALINGETGGVYLDHGRYDVFWERASALKAPIYIHPGNPPDHPHMYEDRPEMWGPTWSWAVETCSHAMRPIFSGLFDRYPDARVILGHMGETLPIQLWRLDSRLPTSHQTVKLKKPPSDYVRENIHITTSGVCADAALRCALDGMGAQNVMFSIDYPFEDTKVATDWISTAAITEAERAGVCYRNATAILRL